MNNWNLRFFSCKGT